MNIIKSEKHINFVKYITSFLLLGNIIFFYGCGTIRGIPSHGGGKRFAIEQELLAAATRATIKKIDLTAIKNSKVNIFVNTIGDRGGGNLSGRQSSITGQLRGRHLNVPNVGKLHFEGNYSNSKETYRSYEDNSSNDISYLRGLLLTYFLLKGVNVVPPSEAEIDVYITVDVFGTVHSRIDWFLTNNEILKAKTTLEVMAVDHLTGKVVMRPQSASMEAQYNEQYILWSGPVSIKKSLKKSKLLLSNFTEL